MAARAKITMSPEEYLAGLKKLEAETNKSANKMENSFKQYGTSINKAGIAMRYVSAEMGAGAVAFGRAFQVLAGGKIAVAVAAITGAIVALKKAWDNLTVSAEEYNLKLEKAIETGQKELETIRKTQSEEDTLMERLQELSERENKTNEEHDEAIRLTQILAGKYTSLGLEINGATGEFEDLADAMKKINAAQKEARLDAIATQIANISQKSDALAKDKLKGGWFSRSVDWLNSLTGGTDVGKQKGIDYTSKSFSDRLNIARDMVEEATTQEDIQFWSEQVDSLTKIIELEKQMDNLRKNDAETIQEEANARKKASEESRKAADEEEAAHQKRVAELEAEMKLQEELDRKASEAAQKRLEEEAKLKRAAEQRRVDAIADLKFSFMRLTGQGDKAAIQEAIYNETKAQGRPLDKATVSDITKRTKAELALARLQNVQTTSPELYAPRVNSLIARGGSAAPMKLPKVEEYQAKTLSSVDKIAKDMGFVRGYLQESGLI